MLEIERTRHQSPRLMKSKYCVFLTPRAEALSAGRCSPSRFRAGNLGQEAEAEGRGVISALRQERKTTLKSDGARLWGALILTPVRFHAQDGEPAGQSQPRSEEDTRAETAHRASRVGTLPVWLSRDRTLKMPTRTLLCPHFRGRASPADAYRVPPRVLNLVVNSLLWAPHGLQTVPSLARISKLPCNPYGPLSWLLKGPAPL